MTESPTEQWQLDLPGHTLTVGLFKEVTNARCGLPWAPQGAAACPLAVALLPLPACVSF